MNPEVSSATSHGGPGLPWLTATWLAIAIGLWWLSGPAPAGLVFDRAAIGQGEWWRWITGHWVHASSRHALWDVAALGLIGWSMERSARERHLVRLKMVLAAATGMLAVNVCLWWCLPQLDRYCGLSGMLNTLFVVALAGLWRERRHPVIAIIALALPLKLAMEIATGQSMFVDMHWASVPETHVAGCAGGVFLLWAVGLRTPGSQWKAHYALSSRDGSEKASRSRQCVAN
jgi:rhomboid family GlyGly-CTERM serine protease